MAAILPAAPQDINLWVRGDNTYAPLPTGSGGGTTLQIVWGEIPVGAINGINLNYTSANPYRPNLLAVYLNGLRLRRTSDYNETGSQSFQFVSAPLAGDSISIDYIQP